MTNSFSAENGVSCAFVPLTGARLRLGVPEERSTNTTVPAVHTARKRGRASGFSMRVRRGDAPRPDIPEALHLIPDMKDIDRKPFSFANLKGKVVYAVNVASEDDYADTNYKLMASLSAEFHDNGFVVLAFPCNWFGQKETRSNGEIKKFVYETYDPEARIILMDKFDYEVNPVFILGQKCYPGEIYWNFHGKFLFGRNGQPYDRFDLIASDDRVRQRVTEAISGGPARASEKKKKDPVYI